MRSYLSLIPISAKVKKRQNRMTILCIILAVFLVTGVFSMADMGVRMEEANAKQQFGNYHIALRNLPAEAAMDIANRKDVESFSFYDSVNTNIREDYTVGGKVAGVIGSDEAWLTKTFDYMTEGRFPKKAGEAVLSENAKTLLGAKIGDTFTLHTSAEDFTYQICGFEDDGGSAEYGAMLVCLGMDDFERVRTANGAPSELMYYLRFRRFTQIRQAITEIKAQFGLEEKQVAENLVLIGLAGFSETSIMTGLYGVAAFLFVLIIVAGVLMISSSLNSNIAQRTAFFGMLRCVGASKKQIIRFVRLEALYWCKSAIPIGVTLGVTATWGICAALRFGVAGQFLLIPLFHVSLIGILSGVLVGMLTVMLAAAAPARRAANVSPVMAVSGNTETVIRRQANTSLLRIETALGIRHATASKKNLLLMTGSFALSIILFLSFSALLVWIQHALTPLRPSSPDLSVLIQNHANTITRDLAGELSEMRGVKRVFGRGFSDGLQVESERYVGPVSLISVDDQQMRWAIEEGWSEDTSGLETARQAKDFVMCIFDQNNPLQKGDMLLINDRMLQIACVLTNAPVDGSVNPTILCSEETFIELTGETGYAVLDIQLEDGASEAQVSAIREAASEYPLSDRREKNREATASYWAFTLLVFGFLAMIAMITLCNMVNSISMSVSARIRQYGAMRSVGMSLNQLIRMICAETLTYSLCGMIVGLAAGLPANRFIFTRLVTSFFGTSWAFPFAATLVIAAFVVGASIVSVYAPAKRLRRMAITEAINAP